MARNTGRGAEPARGSHLASRVDLVPQGRAGTSTWCPVPCGSRLGVKCRKPSRADLANCSSQEGVLSGRCWPTPASRSAADPVAAQLAAGLPREK